MNSRPPIQPAFEEHAQVDVVHVLVVVDLGERQRADAERIVDDEALRLLVSAEAAFRALVVGLRQLGTIFQQATDVADLGGDGEARREHRGRYEAERQRLKRWRLVPARTMLKYA